MIKLEKIGKTYRTDTIETLALEGINIEIRKGEFVSVMGPSGCGKSTLLNIMGLLDKPTAGEIYLDDQEITAKFSERKLAKLRNVKIGFIFQSFHLINELSVLDNVEIPLMYRRKGAKYRRAKAIESLEKVGLRSRMKHFPKQLSGGQRQRVAIARALVGKPEIILADEPTGNLDSLMGQEIIDILKNLNENENVTIVMVTHDEQIAKQTQRIIRLRDGCQVS